MFKVLSNEVRALSSAISRSACTVSVCVSLEVNDVLRQIQRCEICISCGVSSFF